MNLGQNSLQPAPDISDFFSANRMRHTILVPLDGIASFKQLPPCRCRDHHGNHIVHFPVSHEKGCGSVGCMRLRRQRLWQRQVGRQCHDAGKLFRIA